MGDRKSLAAIPAETTHSLLSDEELARVGIAPGLVRLSIGIEHPQDLLADLAQALEQAQGHALDQAVLAAEREQDRSEEHTSELQSPCNLVCRLLLEKKKIPRSHAYTYLTIYPTARQCPYLY